MNLNIVLSLSLLQVDFHRQHLRFIAVNHLKTAKINVKIFSVYDTV